MSDDEFDSDEYNLYDDSSLAPIEPYKLHPGADGFFGTVGKNLVNILIIILNALITVVKECGEINKEKSKLVAHYWNSANNIYEPELAVNTKEYVDKNNYQQYLDAVDNKAFYKILLKNYWSYLYLFIVLIFLIIQILYLFGYSDTSPKWGFIFIPLILITLYHTFHKYSI
tara:strand:+ start:61028 stop:61540 length:513 start_codon:yes stop_codon:yes gene_type:complete